MKRILIPLLTLFLSIPLAAQEKFEVRIGWGGLPILDEANFTDGHSAHFYSPDNLGIGDLEFMYRPQKDAVYMTGQIYGEFSWHVRKKLTIAGGLYFNGIYGDIIDPDTMARIRRARGVSVTILLTYTGIGPTILNAGFIQDSALESTWPHTTEKALQIRQYSSLR